MMRRVFLRVYAAVVASIVLVTVGTLATFYTTFRAEIGSHARDAVAPAVAELAREIADTEPRSAARAAKLEQARARTQMWLSLVPRDALIAEGVSADRLVSGEPYMHAPLPEWHTGLDAWVELPGEDLVLEAHIPSSSELSAALAATMRPAEAGSPVPTSAPPLSAADAARIATGPIIKASPGDAEVLFRAPDGTLRHVAVPLVRPPFPRWLPPLFTLALLALAIRLVIRPVQRELEDIADATRRLSDGDLTARVRLDAKSPLIDLGTRFDRMADRMQAVLENNEDLLRAVSHELRTPIARLLFSLDLLQSSDSEEKRAEHLRRAERTVEEMGELSSELLELARLGDTSPELSKEPAELVELARAAYAREMEVEATAAATCITGEPVPVVVDRRLVTRAIANIVRNARRYGSGEVQVRVEQRDDVAVLHVDDDGPGIAAADRERVLEPFQRVESSRSRESGGVGLGLAIASRVADRHGGVLLIDDSPVLRGARLTLEIPLA